MRTFMQRDRQPSELKSGFKMRLTTVALLAAGAVSCGEYDPKQMGDGEDRKATEQTLVGAPATRSFQNGALPSSSYSGNTDATIKESRPNTNFGDAATLEADGSDSVGLDRSALLRWSLRGIPQGSVVQSASITLNIVDETGSTFDVHALRHAWNESQVTWQIAETGSPWGQPGAQEPSDRGEDVIGTVTGAVGERTINLNRAGIALVQSWVDGGLNAGVVISGPNNANAVSFASSEDATVARRPRLNVTYLPPNSLETGLDFDGVGNHVTMGRAPSLGLSTFTLEAWIKRTGTGQSSGSGAGGVTMIPIVTKGRGEGDGNNKDCNYYFGLRASDGVLSADFEDMATGANHPITGTTTVSSGVWHHVAVTYDGMTWQLFLDGELDATKTVNATPRFDSIQHFGIGTAMSSTGAPLGFFQGVIDEVRVWNYPRSQSEIEAGITSPITTASGLVGRFGLDEGQGSVAGNSAGIANGTINGAAYVAPGAPFKIVYSPEIALLAPTSNDGDVGQIASLNARVTDRDSETHDVRFFGRLREGPEDFSIVALPDTQYYSQNYPAIYTSQTQWIMENRQAYNIKYVPHLGDIVNIAREEFQWHHADAAMSLLETPVPGFPDGMPYCPSVGNHDIDMGSTANFNKYFGVSRFQGRSYYGGHYGSDNDNHWNVFSAGGMDFIVVSLENDTTPDQEVLDWADGLLKAHADRRAIVVSHHIVGTGNPANFGTQGQAIYDNLKDNPNLFLLLSGHVCGEGQRADVFEGRTVHSILTDYQCRANGGNGWLRIMTFSPATDTITFRTYSPTLDRFETDADSEFTLTYDMPGITPGPFTQIGIVHDLSAGETASLTWEGLAPSATYEWYAEAYDGEHTVPTATRLFTTAP